MKIFISSLILMIGILLALGLLLNPTITTTSAFSQGDSVYIAPRGADPNNDQSFVPQFISMPIESTVSWTNDDSIQHTITSDEEGLFVSGPISPGDTFDNTFDTPGEFGYHCSIHPWMTGRVMVG
ncbi:MAG: cupredoxin domain-containing protein [Nitrososphaeraceae archaeon]